VPISRLAAAQAVLEGEKSGKKAKRVDKKPARVNGATRVAAAAN
jgi:hypothetical protein